MIDESLFKVNQIGKDGFIWWIGQIPEAKSWKAESLHRNYKDENKKSKNWPERAKVRIIGYHSFRQDDLKDEELPWAHVMMDPAFGSAQGGEGISSNLTGGEICFGFFLDGDDAQQPVIVGLLHRPRSVQNLEVDKDFAFQPFTGHQGTVPSTKRSISQPVNPKQAPAPQPSSQGFTYKDGFWGKLQDPVVGFSSSLNFIELSKLNLGINSETNFNINYSDTLWTSKENLAVQAFLKKATVTYTPPTFCNSNLIGQITQILQDFIGFTNGLQKYANTYIDPVLNEIVDIKNTISSVASSIGGIIRLIINAIRGGLIKCIIALFKKFIGLVVPCPQQEIFANSARKILDVLFCLFEKLIPYIIEFIEGLLLDLVDSVFSAPACAIEQWVAAILTNVMTSIEESIDVIISGISWLTGGLTNVFDVLNQASTLASQIYSFIGCDELKCTTPSKWVSTMGPSEVEADNWSKMVGSVNVFRDASNELGSVESALSGLSLYEQSSIYDGCNQLVNNPTSQYDLPTLLPGIILDRCIPPVISVYGDGTGAILEPVITEAGSIIAVNIVSPGFGFSRAPTLTVIDNSGYGSGAKLISLIDENGSINKVAVLSSGSGYCQGNFSSTNSGIGTTDGLNTIINLSASKNKIFEGDSVDITVTSSNKALPRTVKYSITGITKKDIKQNLDGILTLTDGIGKIKIDTNINDFVDYKELKFILPDYNKYVSVLINDISGSLADREYELTSKQSQINEGSRFTIKLKTKNVEDGTTIPFTITGIDNKLIENIGNYTEFVVKNNSASLTFNTNKGIIDSNQIFKLELTNKKASIGILIINIVQLNENKNPNACIQDLLVIKPGIGYQITDTATDGINKYDLIISPENGAIFGVKPINNPVCGFPDLPAITINTNTGIGAEIIPIMILDKNPSSSISDINQTPTQIGVVTVPIKVIDCI